jgi:hypothetical protein
MFSALTAVVFAAIAVAAGVHAQDAAEGVAAVGAAADVPVSVPAMGLVWPPPPEEREEHAPTPHGVVERAEAVEDAMLTAIGVRRHMKHEHVAFDFAFSSKHPELAGAMYTGIALVCMALALSIYACVSECGRK